MSPPSCAAPRGESGHFTFDGQAHAFDRRAGLPPAAVDAVAAAVLRLAGGDGKDGGDGGDGWLVDLGAGTGEIGARLAAGGGRYLALDLSLAMLAVCRRRLARPRLAQADGDRPWPVAARRVRAVFASRAVHLLAAEHVAAETARVAHPAGCAVIVGRVRREPGGARAQIRREMRRLLAARGITGRGGEEARAELARALAAHGAAVEDPVVVAEWPVRERPAASLASWRSKDGLAGRAVAPEVRREVLNRLESWARERFGDLEAERDAVETYELAVMHLKSV